MATWSWPKLQLLCRIHIFDCVWNTSQISILRITPTFPSFNSYIAMLQVLEALRKQCLIFFSETTITITVHHGHILQKIQIIFHTVSFPSLRETLYACRLQLLVEAAVFTHAEFRLVVVRKTAS